MHHGSWANGSECRYGSRCFFAHGEHELRQPGGGGGGGGAMGGGGPSRPYAAAAPGGGGGGAPAFSQQQAAHHAAAAAAAAGASERPYGGPPGGVEDLYARQGFAVQGPNGWVMYRTQDAGEPYYHNHNTQLTQWQRPADWPSAA